MHNIKFFVPFLILFLHTVAGFPQNISNGYYNSTQNDTYIYVYNDTIMLPYYGGMMKITILKGVIDNKRKWIKFIPVKDKSLFAFYHDKHKKMKFRYLEEEQSIEILFNLPYNKNWNKFVKVEKPHKNKRIEASFAVPMVSEMFLHKPALSGVDKHGRRYPYQMLTGSI